MEEESWTRNHAEGIMENESWRRNHGEGIMEKESWRMNHGGGVIEEESWRGNLGSVIMAASRRLLETAKRLPTPKRPRRHPGDTKEAPGRTQGTQGSGGLLRERSSSPSPLKYKSYI